MNTYNVNPNVCTDVHVHAFITYSYNKITEMHRAKTVYQNKTILKTLFSEQIEKHTSMRA